MIVKVTPIKTTHESILLGFRIAGNLPVFSSA
jgi:hypothetical protein